jgi:hypothetical protein
MRPKGRLGEELAAQRRENREVRSYEAEYVGSLWHLVRKRVRKRVRTITLDGERPVR